MGSNSRAASSVFFFFFLLFLFLFASLSCRKPVAAATSPGRRTADGNETEGGGGRCSSVEEEEFQFDSEINRRLLADSDPRGTDYDALGADMSACRSTNGQPYQCGGSTGRNAPGQSCGRWRAACAQRGRGRWSSSMQISVEEEDEEEAEEFQFDSEINGRLLSSPEMTPIPLRKLIKTQITPPACRSTAGIPYNKESCAAGPALRELIKNPGAVNFHP